MSDMENQDEFCEKTTEENVGKNKKKSVEENEKPRSKKSIIIELLTYVLLIIICITIIPKYVMQRTEVDGRSMLNTLHGGERTKEGKDHVDSLLVDKISYRFKDPERFDIVTIFPQGDKERYYIKRIIGLPGEKVQIDGNTIYINGKKLEEDFGREPMRDGGIADGDGVLLGKDEYFVLGDNRNESCDSRDDTPGLGVGIVKRKYIDGHAFLRVYPFSEFGTLRESVK